MPEGMSRMKVGTCKFFREDKGYGFLAPDDGGNDVFVHIQEVTRSGLSVLKEGDRVIFDVAASRKKVGSVNAVNLRPAA